MSKSKPNILETDLFIIGGGINGTGVAVDAALRGLKVILCEAEDLASATSSASSKLVHGGLRYLEQYEFKLVKEALREREVLLKKAPHIIHPLQFVLPHAKHLRPVWMIRIGMFLYDILAGKMSLAKSKKISLKNTLEGENLIDDFTIGFSYSDCRIDDARMVVFNAQEAKNNGAKILVQYKCIEVKKAENYWLATLKSKAGEEIKVHAKAVINAGGPWVANIIKDIIETKSKASTRLIKGSHIVVPKLYEGDHAYILQNKDGRIVFAIPYGFVDINCNEFTLIGTTDLNFTGDPRNIKINEAEKEYLCELINTYFLTKISMSDIVWDYAGVRPLYDDESKNISKITREYYLQLEDNNGKLPLISIFGGKITTFRTLSKYVLDKLKPYFPEMKDCITDQVSTVGGDIDSFTGLLDKIMKDYPWLDKKHAYRLAASYGTRTYDIIEYKSSIEELGICFGYNFYECEAKYLVKHEWCYDINAMIWRRSKLGLWLTKKEIDRIDIWLKQYCQNHNESVQISV